MQPILWDILSPLLLVYGCLLIWGDTEPAHRYSRRLHLERVLGALVNNYGIPVYRRLLVGAGAIVIGGLWIVVTALRLSQH
jgi:hypothetical protein